MVVEEGDGTVGLDAPGGRSSRLSAASESSEQEKLIAGLTQQVDRLKAEHTALQQQLEQLQSVWQGGYCSCHSKRHGLASW